MKGFRLIAKEYPQSIDAQEELARMAMLADDEGALKEAFAGWHP